MTINDNIPPNPFVSKSPAQDKKAETKRKSNASPNPGSSRGPNAKLPKHDVRRIYPRKAPNDPNQYMVIQLSNGLTAALISRRNSNQSNNIPVGSPGSPLRFALPGSYPSLPPLACSLFPENRQQHHRFNRAQTFNDGSLLRSSLPGCNMGLPPMTCSLFPENRQQLIFNEPMTCNDAGGAGAPGGENDLNLRGGDNSSSIPDTTVCLVVNVGGLDDPEDFQGMSHFTEHMVHYGSKKYPGEDEICVVVANFGTFNAFTMDHSTSYYNKVPDTLLDRDLELFAEMLTNPSFEENFLRKEVNAVDSEFYLRLSSFRRFLLLPHIAIQNKTKGETHPLAKFTCGNIETLTDCESGGAGAEMKDAMSAHHKEYYVASAMTLSITSTKPLKELEDLVVKYFSDLQTGDRKVLHKTDAEAAGESFKLQNTEDAYTYLKGDSTGAELSLTWILPAALWLENKNGKVTQLLQKMLSDTSPNSLDTYLRTQGWIFLMTGEMVESHYATMFDVTMHLTEAGRKQTENIVQATLAFITALRDSPAQDMARFFEEVKIANQREYYFGSQDFSMDDTLNCAMRLQYNDSLEDLVGADFWEDAQFNHTSMVNALNQMLDRKKLVIMETVPKTEDLDRIAADHKAKIKRAPYSNAHYVIVAKKLKPNPAANRIPFGLPPQNPLLQDEYRRTRINNGAGDAIRLELLIPSTYGEIKEQQLQYKSAMDPTGENHVPKVIGVHRGNQDGSLDGFRGKVTIQFVSKFTHDRSAQTQALVYLWLLALDNKLHPLLSKYNLAGYRVQVDPGVVQVYGFPKHMDEVVSSILGVMLDGEVTPNDFTLAKEHFNFIWEHVLSYQNMLTTSLIRSLMFPGSTVDLLGTMEQLTLGELNNAIEAFRRTTFSVVNLQGNVPIKSFTNIASVLDDKNFGPYMDSIPAVSLLNLKYSIVNPDICKPGMKCIRVKNLASNNLTTTVTNVYFLGPYDTGDDRTNYFTAAMYFLNCQAMLYLRTDLQLGYAVSAGAHVDSNMRVPVMMFLIQVTATANKFSACEVDQRIDEFLAQYGTYLRHMDDFLFDTMKNLTGAPEYLRKEQVADWFSSKFGPDFAVQVPKRDAPIDKCVIRGVRKVSIQELSGEKGADIKKCSCESCSSISSWTAGNSYQSKLTYAVGQGAMQDYFVQPTI